MTGKVICFFNSNRAWGGGEKWHLETALRLKRKNFKVAVFAYGNKELYIRAIRSGLDSHSVKVTNLSFLNPYKILLLVRLFKKYKVHTIILNLSADVKVAGIAAKLAGLKHIIYRRGLALPSKNNLINRYIFKNILTKIIANSDDIKNKLLINHPYLETLNKIVVIYNGVDISFYPAQKITAKKKGDPVVIGNVGRLVEQKAQHYLIELAEALKRKNLNFEIRIVGTGRLYEKLKQMTEKKGVTTHVKFLGFKEKLNTFYQDTDIFILTSQHEGTSNALIESMAWSIPVITFNISSMPEMVENNRNGFIIEWDNIKDLTEKTVLLMGDSDLRNKMGKESYKIVSQKFNIERNLNNLVDLIS